MFKYPDNPPKRKSTNYIVIHCSYTTPNMDIGAEKIDDWHRNGNGWKYGIGYHYVIKRDGTIELGRPSDSIGAHTKNHNYHSIAICLIGGAGLDENKKLFPKANYTEVQWHTLKFVVERLHEEYPDADIVGHRDLQKKACPVFDVKEWVKKEGILVEEEDWDFNDWIQLYHPGYKERK